MKAARARREDLRSQCLRCGCCHFHTTHTEPLRDGRIRRRKECRYCGKKIVTFEASPTDRQGWNCYR
jgi:transcriptional regulator NrdR family protein